MGAVLRSVCTAAYAEVDATPGNGGPSAPTYAAADWSAVVTLGSRSACAPPPEDLNPEAIDSSWREGTYASGTLPSPLGATRLVTLCTPGVLASARVTSRSLASDVGASRSVPWPASITPLTGMILPFPRCCATRSNPTRASEVLGRSLTASKFERIAVIPLTGTSSTTSSTAPTIAGRRVTPPASRTKKLRGLTIDSSR